MANETRQITVVNVKLAKGIGKNGKPYVRYTILGADKVFYTLFENPRNKSLTPLLVKGKILDAELDASNGGNPLITNLKGISSPAKAGYQVPNANPGQAAPSINAAGEQSPNISTSHDPATPAPLPRAITDAEIDAMVATAYEMVAGFHRVSIEVVKSDPVLIAWAHRYYDAKLAQTIQRFEVAKMKFNASTYGKK